MGIIIDTSNLIAAERGSYGIAGLLEQIQQKWGETQTGISAVAIAELAHGVERARTAVQRQLRETLLRDLRATVAVYALTDEIAERAGTISGRKARLGVVLPFADLMIGATALHREFEVLTVNARHFEMIPDLVVRQL